VSLLYKPLYHYLQPRSHPTLGEVSRWKGVGRYVTQRPSVPRFIASNAKCLYILSPENENGRSSELTTYRHLGQRCRMCGVCLHSPYRLRGFDEEGHHVF